jgi:putative membrane protein
MAPAEDKPALTPMTDPQIVQVLAASDSGEIDQGKLAQKKSKNPRVKKFAQQMVQHHTKAKQKGATLAKKAKITAEDTPIAAQLTGAATALLETLKGADAATFDTLYMAGQVQQHQTVLDMLNTQLIPGATDTGLKEHLAEARTMVEGHLTEAQAIVQELGQTGTGGADAGASGAAPVTTP